MNKICLYGASGHGKVVKSVASNNDIEVEAFFDDNSELKEFQGIKVVTSNKLPNFNLPFLISIGDNSIRKRISEKINKIFTTLIHNKAVIDETVVIKVGTVIMPEAIINTDTSIGKHCIINTGAIIEHDCIIEDYVHISPNATITGGIKIGEGTHVGAGAVVIPNIKIGKWTTVGAGAVVVNDVPDYAVVVGNPAKIIKYNKPK